MTEENKNITVTEVADTTPWLVLLTILLLVGKVIGWWPSMGWGWVFLPLWLPFAIVLAVMGIFIAVAIVAFICVGIAALFDR